MVARYMIRRRKLPPQTWRTFLENQVGDLASIDLFTAPKVRFRILYVFLVYKHEQRQVVHFNVTDRAMDGAAAGRGLSAGY